MADEVKPKGKRGRPKKSVEEQASYIVDDCMKPYKIKIDERCYNVIKEGDIQPESYCTSLASALNYIARQTINKGKTFNLNEFLVELGGKQKQIADAMERMGVKDEM